MRIVQLSPLPHPASIFLGESATCPSAHKCCFSPSASLPRRCRGGAEGSFWGGGGCLENAPVQLLPPDTPGPKALVHTSWTRTEMEGVWKQTVLDDGENCNGQSSAGPGALR